MRALRLSLERLAIYLAVTGASLVLMAVVMAHPL